MSNRRNRQSGNNRRPQVSKGPNRAMMEAFQELRRSSATTPVPSGKAYSRKTKHKEW